MGLVLWIDQNELATGLFEKVFKDKGEKFYTLNSVLDFGYLISDLDPLVIVVDAATALKDLGAFKRQYDETQGFFGKKVIIVDPLPGLEFVQNLSGTINRPINPFELPEKLRKLIMEQ